MSGNSSIRRAYTSNRFCLELGQGQPAGWLISAEGGQASTEPVQERMAAGYPVRKHPGTVKFDDITVSCGTGMSKQFYQWLKGSLDYDHQRKDGAIISANYDFKEINRLSFRQGLITEIGFPGLDASSKDPCKLSVKLSPEETDHSFSAGGGPSILPSPIDAKKQKQWQSANFRLRIHGMEEYCRKVSKIEALTVKQKVIENPTGEYLIAEKEPVQIDYPNLAITIPESEAATWYDWHHSFVIRGISDPGQEKTGVLEYLTPDLRTTLFTLNFDGLGIIKYQPDKMESGSDKLRMVKIEMYCEKIDFNFAPDSTWT